MRWRIAIVGVLALSVAISCNQQPVEPLQDAGTTLMNNKGAVVFRGDVPCAVIDGNGDWFPPGFPEEGIPCGTEVATFSKNGNAKATIQASGAPNPTGRTVHWGPWNPGQAMVDLWPDLNGPPYPCFLLGPERDFENPLFTVNWHATVTPSGQATLTCIYQEKWAFRCEDYGNCADD